jgi:predicted transcriptional regulator of viral defense system
MDLDALVRAQHGVVSTRQALDAGLTEDALQWRVASGRWARIGRGLYRAQTGSLDWAGRAHAALLRGGHGLALSLEAAQYVHGVAAMPPPVITVSVPPGREVTRLSGTRFRQRVELTFVRRKGLRVTSAADTVLDLANEPGCGWREAVATTARWVQHRRVTVEQLRAALD